MRYSLPGLECLEVGNADLDADARPALSGEPSNMHSDYKGENHSAEQSWSLGDLLIPDVTEP